MGVIWWYWPQSSRIETHCKSSNSCWKSASQYNLKLGDKRLKAVAVTIGPGQQQSLNAGIAIA